MSLPPAYNLLGNHPNYIYLETGSWKGDSIELALQAKVFSKYIGIESNLEKAAMCRERFRFHKDVEIIHGDSSKVLDEVMKKYKVPMTIFLDAHDSLLDFEPRDKNIVQFPLLIELSLIAMHPIKYHTIIIDDILHLTHPNITGWTKENIEEMILRINPAYKIFYISNPVLANMIIAKP